jgi:hypothetical protein
MGIPKESQSQGLGISKLVRARWVDLRDRRDPAAGEGIFDSFDLRRKKTVGAPR